MPWQVTWSDKISKTEIKNKAIKKNIYKKNGKSTLQNYENLIGCAKSALKMKTENIKIKADSKLIN